MFDSDITSITNQDLFKIKKPFELTSLKYYSDILILKRNILMEKKSVTLIFGFIS